MNYVTTQPPTNTQYLTVSGLPTMTEFKALAERVAKLEAAAPAAGVPPVNPAQEECVECGYYLSELTPGHRECLECALDAAYMMGAALMREMIAQELGAAVVGASGAEDAREPITSLVRTTPLPARRWPEAK